MTEQEILAQLKEKGYRTTMARSAIVHIVATAKHPLSAADVHALLSQEAVHPNVVTVYRELALLEEEGILRSMQLKDGVKRYCNATAGHHHHLVCTKCDTVSHADMSCDPLHSMEKQLAKNNNFTIKSHSLEFYGLCKKCT